MPVNVPRGIIFFRKNALALVLTALALGLASVVRLPLGRFLGMVDWDTILTLSGLLLITTGIRESGVLYLLAYRISRRIDSERLLALFLVFLAALLSIFLTNDIALFIAVPLTLTLQRLIGEDYGKIIVFQAIAANVGSSLTPIGNPQNIFLWHQWGISFLGFVEELSLLAGLMAVCLSAMVYTFSSSRKIEITNANKFVIDRCLFITSSTLLILFIVSAELGLQRYFLPLLFIIMFVVRKSSILESDWGLVFLFIIIFVDVDLICRTSFVRDMIPLLDLGNPSSLFFSGALLSQFISNVPSALLLAHHSTDFRTIAYGVNVGGNGTVIGSFANLIALRFIHGNQKYLTFHAYSLPYFALTLAISCWLFI